MKNPFNDIIEKGKEEQNVPDSKSLIEKRQERLEEKAENLKEISSIKRQAEFNEVKEEVDVSTNSNLFFLIFSPIVGFITGPALLLFVIDIAEEQLRIIRITLIGNAIGLILTVIMVLLVFKDGIRKSVLSVYRHFFTKKEVDDLRQEHIVEQKTALETENKDLKEKVSKLEKDLYEYNIEKELEKRGYKKNSIG